MNQPAPALAAAVPQSDLPLPLPNPRHKLMAMLANINHLVVHARKLARAAEQIQKALPEILDHLNEEEAEDNVWVCAVVRTPAQVAAAQANTPNGTQQWWIVFVGREPLQHPRGGRGANPQVPQPAVAEPKGRQAQGPRLDYYRARYEANEVVKWVELV